ncbi:hypothetical protein [Olleya sp. Bg11-27]|uniref:hypothetical protein n=1 Tax=Olleya sp. Bg11-27 TaxID=2058135 RepID=UPI000C30936A|nr:hypothetical protein [Olleya sp. Bg11-27]AUC75660.1 hypothetical protein CW732_08230 [Olleya sp. Bg11-27]
MNKKISILILFIVFGFSKSIGQNLDLNYVKNWLNESNAEYTPELVRDFFINGEYYELDNVSEFNQMLEKINIVDINSITYSSVNSCGYSSGKGEIYVLTKSEKTQAKIKELIEIGTEIYDNEEPMIIVLNNKKRTDITFSKLLSELDVSRIYDISISPSPVPKEVYGINAENGIIKVWTE